VVPLDLSLESLCALDFALPLAKRLGARVHLVHVYEGAHQFSTIATSPLLWSEAEAKRHLADEVLDAITASEVGACLDAGHAFLAGDMPALLRKLRGHLRMVQAHDNGGAHDDHWPPGDGQIDWEATLRELVEIEFHGALILEMAGQANVEITMANARRGRQYLREIARRIALSRRAESPVS